MAALFKHFDTNTQGRDFVVGDIHGCFYLLEALLHHVAFDETVDRVFSLGDLCDHGPESERATEFLTKPWFHAIRGNHELMMLRGAMTVEQAPTDMEAMREWLTNGGEWFFSLDMPEQQALYSLVARLPVAMEVALADSASAALVHGDVLGDSWTVTRARLTSVEPDPDYQKHMMRLVWGRTRAMNARTAVGNTAQIHPDEVHVAGADAVFFGHTPMPAPLRVANTRWLDTGAGKGGALTLGELKVDGRVWSISEDCLSVHEGWHSTL